MSNWKWSMQSYAQENAGEEHYEGKQDFGD
jgi:hypothetical protein